MMPHRLSGTLAAALLGVCAGLAFSPGKAQASFGLSGAADAPRGRRALTSALEAVLIPADGSTVQTVMTLAGGQPYAVVVSGIYRYGPEATGELGDAQYRQDAGGLWSRDYPSVELNGARPAAGIRDLSRHTFEYAVTGDGNRLSLRIYDTYYGDNAGELRAYVFEGGSAHDHYVDAHGGYLTNGDANSHKNPDTVIGSPDCRDYISLGGGGGNIVMDMGAGEEITNGPGTDFRVYEVDETCGDQGTAEPYEAFIGDGPTGPWTSVGSGSGISEFHLPDGVASARYLKVVDHKLPVDNTWSAPGADIYGAQAVVFPRETAEWTLLFYLDGDNDLEQWSVAKLEQLGVVGSTAEVNVAVQVDRNPGYENDSADDWAGTKRFYVVQGTTRDPSGQTADLGEADMGDPDTLIDFLAWGMATFPAERYAVILQDHGSGWTRYHTASRQAQDSLLSDDTSNDSLQMEELRYALSAATGGGAQKIDLLGFDACLMGGIEVDAQIRPFVKTRIGSEEIAYSNDWNDREWLADLAVHPEVAGAAFADGSFSRITGDTWSVVDLDSPYDALISAVDAFAAALSDYGDAYAEPIRQARWDAQDFGYYRPPDGRESEYRYRFVDLYDFARLVAAGVAEPHIQAAAGQVSTAAEGAVIREYSDPRVWPRAYGISIYFPLFGALHNDMYDGANGILSFTAGTRWDEWLYDYYNRLPAGPDDFNKVSPANGAPVPASPLLTWNSSPGADYYEICVQDNLTGACLTGWKSVADQTSFQAVGLEIGKVYFWQVRAVNEGGFTYADWNVWHILRPVPAPDSFQKTGPANGATESVHPTLSWEAAAGADGYEYCLDTSNNYSCDTGWISAGAGTSVDESGLTGGRTYYWQVRAVNDGGPTEADGGGWWSFTTPAPPAAFGKAGPADGSYTSTAPAVSWEESTGAEEYDYCVDTTNNGVCDSTWVSAGIALSAGLSGLGNNDAHYWLVRAVGDGGITYADGGVWWRFTARNQTFDDVPIDHSLWAYIEAFYNSGITTGCGVSPLIYCPEQNVTRAAMAVFILRAKHGAGYAPPAAGHYFADLPAAGKEWQEAWVDQLFREGITGGCGTAPLVYCPENPITRAAMAVFILRAKYGSSYAPPAASHFFADLPVAGKEWMEPWVDQLYREGITTGCGISPPVFCPDNPVKRQAMAAFIVRAFNLPLP